MLAWLSPSQTLPLLHLVCGFANHVPTYWPNRTWAGGKRSCSVSPSFLALEPNKIPAEEYNHQRALIKQD